MSGKPLRQLIRSVLTANVGMTSAQVAARLKVEPRRVSTALSGMVKAGLGVKYVKPAPGEYGKYYATTSGSIQNVSLKLAQLRACRSKLFASGLTLVDDLIADYENLL